LGLLLTRQILDSIKHATGYEQTATEQAKEAGSDFKRGAENFGQGAKDEFKTVGVSHMRVNAG